MTTRYLEERECVHGRTGDCDAPTHGLGRYCPGGERRELTDIETVEASQTDEWLAHDYALPVPNPGRYLIVPLEEPV